METLEIYEDSWLNGSERDEQGVRPKDVYSSLYNKNVNRFCCLGLYLRKNCRIPLKDLSDVSCPWGVVTSKAFPHKARWLLNSIGDGNTLMGINDSVNVLRRKKTLQKIFKRNGVEVVFKKGADPKLPKPKPYQSE